MRKRRDVLREGADAVHIGGIGISLAAGLATDRAMVSANICDLTAGLGEVDVVGQKDWQHAGIDVRDLRKPGLYLLVEDIDLHGPNIPGAERIALH